MAEPKLSVNTRLPIQKGPGHGSRGVPVEKATNVGETLKRLALYFEKEKRRLLRLLVVVVIVVVCSITVPRLQSEAIDWITEGNFSELPKILIAMGIVYGISCICTLFQGRISAILSQSIVKHIREDLFGQVVNLPIRYLDQHSHGDIMSRMTNDVENIANTISQSVSTMVSGVLTITGTAAMMLYMCPQLAVLSWITVILVLVLTKVLSSMMRKFYRKRQELLGNLNGVVEEMVSGYWTVTAFDQQENVIEQFDENADDLTKVAIKADIIGSCMGPAMNLINNIGFVIIAAFGGYFALQGIISVGVISAFIIYAKQFGRPIEELANVYGQIQTAIAGAERVFAIMDEEREDKSGTKDMDETVGSIEFSKVNFSYSAGKQVLYDFSFHVRAGHKIALVGATGSGKTTVVNLLMRFYDIDSGSILIDGVNIKDIDCNELRRDTAIVLQDTILFADTIRNNLKYSNENATEEEIKRAVEMCNCTQMIENLPEGYDTMLSSGGMNLSQGQRQLLSITRAFLADPRILILDEATSSVDTRTEKHIQDAMISLMENRTSLIIAHRLSTIQDADCIIVMDQGRIAEVGNHNELLKKQGQYYGLYMTQFAGKAI